MKNIEEWLSFISQWALLPLSIIWVYEAVSQVASRRMTRLRLALGILGMAFLLGNAAVVGWATWSLSATLDETFRPTNVQELSEDVIAQMTPGERAEKTKLLAQMNFSNNGALFKHFTPDGSVVTYAPGQTEIEARVSMSRQLAQARANLQLALTKSYTFVVFVLVAIAAGVWKSRRVSELNVA